jgi:hydroxymethylbilane synthase
MPRSAPPDLELADGPRMAGSAMIIGVHGRGLARSQAESLGEQLAEAGADYQVRYKIIDDLGGTRSPMHDDHVAEHRGEIGQLHSMLRGSEIDVVIHRGFDLRGDVPDDLRIGAVLARQNPYDVLLASEELWLDELDETHRIGVVQLRARAQLLDYRPELQWDLISGDAADWLTAMIDGEIDALIAPGAPIEQLGLQERVCEIFPPELLVPAPGSGVLVCLVRQEDEENLRRLRILHDTDTLTEYAAEVSLVEALGGVWEQPIGALARLEDDLIRMAAMVANPDGSQILRDQYVADVDDAELAGEEFAALLLHAGARELLDGTGEPEQERPEFGGELPGREPEEDEYFDFEDFVEIERSAGDEEDLD